MDDKLVRLSDTVTICCDLFCGHPCKPEERDTCGLVEAVQAHIPAVDAVEARHGEWVWSDNSERVCSICGNSVSFSRTKEGWIEGIYCQTCGARMDGEEAHNASD